MVFSVGLCGFGRVMRGVMQMTLSHLCVMSGLLVFTSFMQGGCVAMVARGVLVMVGCLAVMVCGLLRHVSSFGEISRNGP